jgi:protein-S-isoprenylcysteine O-methyltransferase Ste14
MEISGWILFLAVGVYGLVHSILASTEVKQWLSQWLGQAVQRGYRLAYNLFAVASLLPVLALAVLLPDTKLYAIPMPWRLITLAIQATALVGLLLGVRQTGAWSFLGIEQVLKVGDPPPPRLVVDGFYRWVRHPLYTFGLVFIWLTPLMTRNLLVLYLGLSAYLVIGAWFEERKLLHEFGEEYARYRSRTPMLVPGLHFGRIKEKQTGS